MSSSTQTPTTLAQTNPYSTNVVVGPRAGSGQEYTVAVGYGALRQLESTAGCAGVVAVGGNCVQALETAKDDVFLGSAAAQTLQASSANVVVGANAWQGALSGSGNVILGAGALQCQQFAGTQGADNNTVLGCAAGANLLGDNNLVLGANAGALVGAGANNIVLGTGDQTSAPTGHISLGHADSSSFRLYGQGLIQNNMLKVYVNDSIVNLPVDGASGGSTDANLEIDSPVGEIVATVTQGMTVQGANLQTVPTLAVLDTTSGSQLSFLPSAKANGSYNPLTRQGDQQLVALKSGAENTQNLVICPHSSATVGLRMTPTSVVLGAGGSSALPTAALSLGDGAVAAQVAGAPFSVSGSSMGTAATVLAQDASSQQSLGLVPFVATTGQTNPLVRAGDQQLLAYKPSASNTQNLTLSTQSGTSSGVRITPTSVQLGAGGAATQPTAQMTFSNGAIQAGVQAASCTLTGTNMAATPTLAVADATSGQQLCVLPSATNAGSYNPLVQTGDQQILAYKPAQPNTQSLTLAPHSSTAAGLRVTPTSLVLGAGGSSTDPAVLPLAGAQFNGTTGAIAVSAQGGCTIASSTIEPTPTLSLIDTPSGQQLSFLPATTNVQYSPMAEPGDQQIVAWKSGAPNTQSLLITPGSSNSVGVRLTATSALLGAGGTDRVPLASVLCDGGSNTVDVTADGGCTITSTSLEPTPTLAVCDQPSGQQFCIMPAAANVSYSPMVQSGDQQIVAYRPNYPNTQSLVITPHTTNISVGMRMTPSTLTLGAGGTNLTPTAGFAFSASGINILAPTGLTSAGSSAGFLPVQLNGVSYKLQLFNV